MEAGEGGVAEESGYPHLWLEVTESAYVKAERRMLGHESSREKMQELCELFIAEFGVPSHLPFLASDPAFSEPPDDFEERRKERVEFLRRDVYLVTGPGPEPKPGMGMGTHPGTGGKPDGVETADGVMRDAEATPSPAELLEGDGWEEG